MDIYWPNKDNKHRLKLTLPSRYYTIVAKQKRNYVNEYLGLFRQHMIDYNSHAKLMF